jgi:hypothetical protein
MPRARQYKQRHKYIDVYVCHANLTIFSRFNLIFLSQYRCKCGNCSRSDLSNPNECLCCCEIEECAQALISEQVLNDVGQDAHLKCITEHPGFDPICLQKWSLRMAADKYRTKSKAKYQMDSENRLVFF